MGRRPRRNTAWHILAALVLTASGADAKPPSAEPSPEPDAKTAQGGTLARLRAQAEQALRDGRFADARDAYLAIWQGTGELNAGCNVGRLSFRVHDMVRAVEFLERCASMLRDPAKEADVRIELALAQRSVVEIHVRAPAGTDVSIDGVPRGRAPVVAYVAPGSHKVHGFRATGADMSATVIGEAGETRLVDLKPELFGWTLAPPFRPDKGVVIAGTVASALLLGAGTVLTVVGAGNERSGDKMISDYPNRCLDLHERCEDARVSYQSSPPLKNWGTAAFVGGAALAAGTLGYVVFPRNRIMLTQVGAGFVVRGTW